MRHASRPSVKLGVVALDQQHLLRRLLPQIVPLVRLVRAHTERLALTIRVDQLDRDEVAVRHTAGVNHTERVFVDRGDGTPDVDDLVAGLEELGGLGGWEVMRHALRTGFVGLVDVDALDGAAKGGGGLWGGVSGRRRRIGNGDGAGGFLRCLGTDGVVEDEDTGGTGAEKVGQQGTWGQRLGNSRILQDPLDFWIIHLLDLLLVGEALLLAGASEDLKSGLVKRKLVFIAADITDDVLLRFCRAKVRLRLVDVGRRWALRAFVLEVVEGRLYVSTRTELVI